MNTPTKRPIRPIPFYLVLLFLALIGAMLLVVGVMSGASSWAFASRAIRTQGTVVRHDNRILRSGVDGRRTSNTKCRAVVSYQVGGKSYDVFGPVRTQQEVRDGWPKVTPIGSQVTVLYDPDRPEEAVVESFSEQWAGVLVYGGLGLTFLLLGSGLLRYHWRRWDSQVGKAGPGLTNRST